MLEVEDEYKGNGVLALVELVDPLLRRPDLPLIHAMVLFPPPQTHLAGRVATTDISKGDTTASYPDKGGLHLLKLFAMTRWWAWG